MQKSSIQNGLFMGVAMIIATFVLSQVNPRMFITTKTYLLFVIFLLLLFKAGRDAKNNLGGKISYGNVFKNMFIAGAIGTFLCSMFEYVLFNFIDPNLIDIQREVLVESMEAFSGFLGDDGLEMMDELQDQIEDQPIGTISATLSGYIIRLIAPVGLFSAFFAFIFRTKENYFDDYDSDNKDNKNDDDDKRYVVKD